jgi:hypothetical protein
MYIISLPLGLLVLSGTAMDKELFCKILGVVILGLEIIWALLFCEETLTALGLS